MMTRERVKWWADMLTNVTMACACVAVSSAVVWQVMSPSRRDTTIAVGTTIPDVKAVRYGAAEYTVILGVSSTCQYCTQSMPFYREMLDETNKLGSNRVQVIAVSAEPIDRLDGYLREHQMANVKTENVALQSVLIRMTPTVVIVDRSGKVRASWIGRFDDARVREVIEKLS